MDPDLPGIDPVAAVQLDVFFRRLYMFLFLLFNALYWSLLYFFSYRQSQVIEEKFEEYEKMNIDFVREEDTIESPVLSPIGMFKTS